MFPRDLAMGLLLLAASGCIVDGNYSVQGAVSTDGAERAPIEGATASVAQCIPRADPTETTTTNSRGEYRVDCWFGGMCLLFWCRGVGVPDTTVEFAAPGYERRSVKLLGTRSDGRPSVGKCDPAGPSTCLQLDVTLDPVRDR